MGGCYGMQILMLIEVVAMGNGLKAVGVAAGGP